MTELDAMEADRDEWRAQHENLLVIYQATLVQMDEIRKDRDRWVNRMKALEGRIYHAIEALSGSLSIPSLNELRKARGLEPLHNEGRDRDAE